MATTDLTARGFLSQTQETFLRTLADCDTLRRWIERYGPDGTQAKSQATVRDHLFPNALPAPTGQEYTGTEYRAHLPYVLVWNVGFELRHDAVDTGPHYLHQQRLLAEFCQQEDPRYVDDPRSGDREFENWLGEIVDELLGKAFDTTEEHLWILSAQSPEGVSRYPKNEEWTDGVLISQVVEFRVGLGSGE